MRYFITTFPILTYIAQYIKGKNGQYIVEIFPKLKNKSLIRKSRVFNTLTCNFNNILVFKELEKNYILFSSLKNLQIIFITNAKTTEELFFLLNSFKFSTKITKNI